MNRERLLKWLSYADNILFLNLASESTGIKVIIILLFNILNYSISFIVSCVCTIQILIKTMKLRLPEKQSHGSIPKFMESSKSCELFYLPKIR